MLLVLSYLGFLLAIARYRRHWPSLAFVLLCCGLLSVLRLLLFAEQLRSPQPPSEATFWLVSELSFIASGFCLFLLGVAEWIGKLWRLDNGSGVPFIQFPRSGLLTAVLIALACAMFFRALFALQQFISPARTVVDILGQQLREQLFSMVTGAIGSGLTPVALLAALIVLLFAISVMISPLRSQQLAKVCVAAYLVVTMFTFFLEPSIALAIASYRFDFTEAAIQAAMKEAPGQMLSKPLSTALAILPAGVWLGGGVLLSKWINRDFALAHMTRPALSEYGRAFSPYWANPERRRFAKLVAIGFGISVLVWLGIRLIAILFTESESSVTFPILAMHLSALAVVAIELRHLPRRALLSWLPLEKLAEYWLGWMTLAFFFYLQFLVLAIGIRLLRGM